MRVPYKVVGVLLEDTTKDNVDDQALAIKSLRYWILNNDKDMKNRDIYAFDIVNKPSGLLNEQGIYVDEIKAQVTKRICGTRYIKIENSNKYIRYDYDIRRYNGMD